MFKNKLILVATAILAASLWGCGSNYDSGGDQTGAENTLANAQPLGITNCLTCHDTSSKLADDFLNKSRHGNYQVLVANPLQPLRGVRKLNDALDVGATDPSRSSWSSSCDVCHDPYQDGQLLSTADIAMVNRPVIGCEACHGGGQYHNGIALGIPFPVPGPGQCGKCHQASAPGYHADSSSGNNIRRNVSDTHFDNPNTAALIEGYVIRAGQQNGCVDCHFGGHRMDLTKNYQWANSGHGGKIKTIKDLALATGVGAAVDAPTRLQLLADVTAAGSDGDDYAWPHYDWDDTVSRGSCQVCHTATGIANFLDNPTGYDLTGKGNNYSHLAGWVADDPNTPEVVDNVASGHNELLYCWGCHSDSSGALRNPGPIPLDYTYGGVMVTLPEARKSNVCVKCHGGRGNNDTILANVAAADVSLTDSVNRSTRSAEHHAPTAGSLYAAQTHSGYEYVGQVYTTAPAHASFDVGTTGRGPCVNCHLGGSTEAAAAQKNHTFTATEHDGAGLITTIVHATTCNTAACHNTTMTVGSLQNSKNGFVAAKATLAGLLSNAIPNYLVLNISTTSNGNYKTVPVNAYGAFQNNVYMGEDPCAYVHNSLYAKRLLFDSIDWMQDGDLDGTIVVADGTAMAYLNGGTRP